MLTRTSVDSSGAAAAFYPPSECGSALCEPEGMLSVSALLSCSLLRACVAMRTAAGGGA